jgi:F-type H+-transporting ATPase subunit a
MKKVFPFLALAAFVAMLVWNQSFEHAHDPFRHTWNTWELDFGAKQVDLHSIPAFASLGITNGVLMLFVVALALVGVGVAAGGEAKRALAEGRTPRGLGHLIEVFVEFIRNEIVKPQMPHHYRKGFFNAYFCTLFFFIVACNLIGLVPAPFGHNPTGMFILNAALAFGCTFLVIIGSGFYEHGAKWIWTGFVPHGVPLWIAPLIWVIEIVGLVVKPFSLTIRLTANMTAGHIILAVLMGLLMTAVNSIGVAALVRVPSGFGYLAISGFEIGIAFIQAYIFTMLSAVFVGMSLSHEH